MERRLAAILAADVVGYSWLMEDDEVGTLSRLDGLKVDILDPLIDEHRGRVIKQMGDGFLIEFASVIDAVTCASEWQAAVGLRMSQIPESQALLFRIGVNLGDVIVRGDDVYGDGVNVAVRLEQMAEPGGIWISRSVYDQIERKVAIPFEAMGLRTLKNLNRQIEIWRWTDGGPQNGQLGQVASRSKLPPGGTPPNNLPGQLSSFIGRSNEIEEIRRQLADTRLLTLTGAGGCGKTRLASKVAFDVFENFADGVWLVSLASLSDASLIAQSVAKVLSIREQPGHSLDISIAEHLASKSVMLIIDNCEHVLLDCAQLVEDLLRACPNLKVLATSREALAVPGEMVHLVEGLAIPKSAERLSREELIRLEAVQLFVDRARLRNRAFNLTPENVTVIADICARLDGIPLAIELAAARIRVLSVQQIAERLGNAFELLSERSRSGLSHHQTLRMTMDWSYSLLSDEEAALFRRMSVFAGGFSLEAVEAICAAERSYQLDALDLLQRLVDKSTVTAEEHGAVTRYRLLETLRQYGQDKLSEAGEMPVFRRAHMEYYLAFAKDAEPNIQGSGRNLDQADWLDRLELDHDNLRSALKYGEAEADGSLVVALAAALWRFWEVRGYLTEGREALRNALASGGGAAPEDRAKALDGAGRLAWRQGDFSDAHKSFSESLTLWRRAGDAAGEANSVHGLARAALNLGDYSAARRSAETSLTIQRSIQNDQGIASAINTLGEISRAEGDLARAKQYYSESLKIFRSIGDTAATVSVLHNLGYTSLKNGDNSRSEAIFREALCLARDLKDRLGIFSMLGGLACVAYEIGRPERAVELFAAADSVGRAWGYAGDRIDQHEVEYRLAGAKLTMENESFKHAWARGQGQEPEAAIASALEGVDRD